MARAAVGDNRFTMCIRFALGLLLAAGSGWAQQVTGTVGGRVVNSRNEAVTLVQIQLRGALAEAIVARAVTTAEGTFQLPDIAPGSYVLETAAVDYYVVRQEFTVAAGETKNFEVVLSASNTRRSDSVDVSAGVFEDVTQASASAITLEGAERKNLASVLADDPLRAVQSLPGVSSNNDFSSEFSLRGAPFGRIGLYLDGVLLHAPFHTTDGQADNGSLTIFNGDMTGNMTLFEGAWPVRYSDRTAGVLAVETREGSRDEIHDQFNASASNASLLAEGPWGKNKRGSWMVAFRKSYLQYILNRIDFGDSAPLSFGFTDGQARLSYDLTPKHTIGLSYLEGSSGVDRTRYQSELSASAVMTSAFRFTLLNLSSRYTPSARLLITSHGAWSRERGDVANRDNTPLSGNTFAEWTGRSDATYVWSGKHTLDFGSQVRQTRDDGIANRFLYTPALTSALDTFRGSAHQLGAYVQQSFSLASNHVHLTAGIREDEHSQSQPHITSPYASASFQPWAKTRLQFDWGQYAQFPELSQFFSTFAVGHLLPERATHYEAAVEQRLDEHTRLRVEVYDRQDRDLLATPLIDPRLNATGAVVGAVATAPLLNSQRGYARGVQIFLQRRIDNGFTGWVSYAYGRAVLRDGVLAVRFPSDYDPRSTFNAYASRRVRPTVNLSAHFAYGSGMPLPGFYRLDPNGYALSPNRNALRAPAYQRTDIRMNKAFVHKKTKTTLFAEVVNVSNHSNRDFDTPGPYDPATQRTYPKFYSMFPILPSAGMVFDF